MEYFPNKIIEYHKCSVGKCIFFLSNEAAAHVRDHPFSKYIKHFRKENISYPLKPTHTCAY